MLTSYLKPHPTVWLFSWSVSFTLCILNPLPSATPILSCTALCALLSSRFPVLDRLSKQASIPPSSTACPALAFLPPSTSSPGSCQTLYPHATILFLPYRPLSGRPPFAVLGVIQAPLSTPVGSLFWFTSYLRHFSNHFPRPFRPRPQA